MNIFKYCSVMVCLLCTLAHTISSPEWAMADDVTLEKIYFPYELCVLRNAHKFDSAKSIHKQPLCLPQLTTPLLNISTRCWLGSKQQRGHDGVCVKSSKSCTPLSDRKGFWKHWKNLPASTSKLGYEGDFVNAIKFLEFNILLFTGDSMALQMAQRLLCGLIRKDLNSVKAYHGLFTNLTNFSTCSLLTVFSSAS